MIEALSYAFVQNAIIAGVLVSIISGVIGSLVVVNRMVFLAGGIAHAAYGGIGLAFYFGLPIFFGTSAFALLAALIMAFATIKRREKTDTFIGLIWAVGMAIGIVLVDLSPGYNVDLMSYLFGSILAVTTEDIYFMGLLLGVIAFVILFWYREILAVSYDSEYAALSGVNANFFYILILLLSAFTVVIAMKVVGLILVIALLTIPTYIAQSISSSLSFMMLYSGIFASLFTLTGLSLSYSFDISSGASIILVSAFGLTLFTLAREFLWRRG
jgi:zinc transport system permease protein